MNHQLYRTASSSFFTRCLGFLVSGAGPVYLPNDFRRPDFSLHIRPNCWKRFCLPGFLN